MNGNDTPKVEKKRLKAEQKFEKKRLKSESESGKPEKKVGDEPQVTKTASIQSTQTEPDAKPWYKNPSWIRAIAAVITMIIVLLTFILAYLNK